METRLSRNSLISSSLVAAGIALSACTNPPVETQPSNVFTQSESSLKPNQHPTDTSDAATALDASMKAEVTAVVRTTREKFCAEAIRHLKLNTPIKNRTVTYAYSPVGTVAAYFESDTPTVETCAEVRIEEFPNLTVKQKFDSLSKTAQLDLEISGEQPFARAGIAKYATNRSYVGIEGAMKGNSANDAVFVDNEQHLAHWPVSDMSAVSWIDGESGYEASGISQTNAAKIISTNGMLKRVAGLD